MGRTPHVNRATPAGAGGPILGTYQQALDTACGLYLNDPTAWT
jgi:hypothetical protein